VELVEVADDYRGTFGRDDPQRAEKFAALVDDAISKLADKSIGVAGFIAETFPSVGGQIIPPAGYLQAVYAKIRAAGGLCIADEVQTGLGRLGDYYFGFEDIVDDEALQTNAKTQGDRLLAGLRNLQNTHDCIGDVRGIGLFIGVDLVTDRTSKTPATALASHVKNRMREHRILLGTEGPQDNILKIRPPLTIGADDVDMIIATLDMILGEWA